ncbi:MAG: YHS domain-containing protein [Sedimentisphaerales bacterium]|nr:YHS domain-containing protein [Sedimentisphaerales bacterium]
MNGKMKQFKVMFMVVSLLLVGLFMINGCKKDEPTPAETTTSQMQGHEGHDHAAMMEESAKAVAAAIEQTTCPVMEGNPINKALFVEYKGKKVYFCCPGCEEKFNAEPEKYIAKLPQFQQQTQ